MKYIGTNANKMIDGAFRPARMTPLLATTRPRLAARLYAGAVEATPTTIEDSRPTAPAFRPLPSAASGNPSGALPSTTGIRGQPLTHHTCDGTPPLRDRTNRTRDGPQFDGDVGVRTAARIDGKFSPRA